MKNTIKSTMINTVFVMLASATNVNAEVAQSGAYKIDAAHSSVQFSVHHLGTATMSGRFNTIAGNLTLNANGKSATSITIQTGSIDTNHQKRDAHLRSPDFFNAKQYPHIKFISNNIKYNTDGQAVSISGKLELHGKTRPVTFKLDSVGAGKDPWGGYRAGYDATATIKRSEFGMNFMPGGIGDEITITINIEAIKI